jgi:hypothetical protein
MKFKINIFIKNCKGVLNITLKLMKSITIPRQWEYDTHKTLYVSLANWAENCPN